MTSPTFSALSSPLKKWAKNLQDSLDIPVLLRYKDKQTTLKLGHFEEPKVTVHIQDASGATALMNPSLDTLGQAYVEGHLNVHGQAQDIIEMAHSLAKSNVQSSGKLLGRLAHRVADAVSHNKKQDQQAIEYHYDVSNDFYAQWLDPQMIYSCAYFENGDETLEQAQLNKLDHILTKVRLQPGQRLLDIGCGWGALVLRAAQKFGAQCVGITLSQNQYELARERVKAAGLEDQIEIRLQDYRDLEGSFDRITSVGMCEHVGLKNMQEYFHIIHDRLTPDGWLLNHNICSTDADNAETSHGGGRFIDQYVFPHGELPHISTTLYDMQKAGLEAIDVESLRRHYERTLQCWSQTFEDKSQQLQAMVEDKTWRIWRMYLIGCQWAFENDEVSVYQVLAHRAGQSAQSLPWSRQWMYANTSG